MRVDSPDSPFPATSSVPEGAHRKPAGPLYPEHPSNSSSRHFGRTRRAWPDGLISTRSRRPERCVDPAITHLHGHAAIAEARPALFKLAAKHGQSESVQDLSYFLEKPGVMNRTPHLILVGENDRTSELTGALLIHEFRPFGYATRAFAVYDRSGRGVLLSAPEARLELALRATGELLQCGANIVLLSCQCEATPHQAAALIPTTPGIEWAIRTRHLPTFLPLSKDYEATLASLGHKTRANLRYYRRRAETELQCRFMPEVKLSLDELLAFNRQSGFPVPNRVLRWRMDVLQEMQDPYVMGLKDGKGHWLSLIAGRRFDTSTEILWQMNMGDLPRHSIVSAMRSYHMEHEISRGATRLYVEGGTAHSMQHSFEKEPITDLIFVRSRIKPGITRLARRYVRPDNVLMKMLTDASIKWHAC